MHSSISVSDPRRGEVLQAKAQRRLGDRAPTCSGATITNYDVWGGGAGDDHRYSALVEFDSEWRQVGGYRFPASVLERFAPTSNSGGSGGDDGLLYVTGHDRKEIYVLPEPGEGPTLEHIATIDVPLDGQAWSWDRSRPRTLFSIRRGGQVVAVEVPQVLLPPER